MSSWPFPTSAGRNPTAASATESFDIACSCGQQIVGERQSQPQIAECAMCSERFLILPVNPYPVPQTPGSSKRKKKKSKTKSGFSSSVLASTCTKYARPVVVWPMMLGRKAARTSVGVGRGLLLRIVAVAKAIRAQITLLRFVVALICALVGGTVYWQVRESRREEAMIVANSAYDRGIEALQQNDILTAYEEFAASKAAMDLLERDDMQARQVRQYAGELAVATQLGTASLFAVLDEAAKEQRNGHSKSWNDRFVRQYAGQWLILELTGRGMSSPSADGTSTVVFPSVFNGEPVVLTLPPSVAQHIPSLDDEVSLIFAAQWSECRYVEVPSPRWLLSFRPETAFLWVHYETYEATGYEPDSYPPLDDLKRTLSQQAKWTGIEQ